MKQFEVPAEYRSPLITAIKQKRKLEDRLKKDFSPTLLDFGDLHIYLARHFGFCYGVENAIEIAFRTVQENPGKRIFLLSEMIHNPQVNKDLQESGVQFLQDTYGRQLIPFDTLTTEDVVLIPAFGTTRDIENMLQEKGIPTDKYNTTCPFVEKVWNRGEQIAKKGYSIVIHGKPKHEETRATFSHAAANAPSVIVNDMGDAIQLAAYIKKEKPADQFYEEFKGRYSEGFTIETDLQRLGVINQTTQLASDTQAIAEYLKEVMIEQFGLTTETVQDRFADTRDTLCYATNDNQTAVKGMLDTAADLAIVVGGFNSSNTTHLVEILETRFPAYFINDEAGILNESVIRSFNIHTKSESEVPDFLPTKTPVKILLTSGASCPDAIVERVIERLLEVKGVKIDLEKFAEQYFS